MQKIVPHLWFNTQAIKAAEFYVSAFGKGSKITGKTVIRNTPSGNCDFVMFDLAGYSFMGISAGPHFKLNPSISFMVNFDPSVDKDARKNLDSMWTKLSEGGKPLMPIDTYPFSERYGWIEDKYGLNWQLILTKPEGEPRPFIMPSLMFTGDNTGNAGPAMDFYTSVFNNAKRGLSAPYPPGVSPEKAAKLMFAEFMLEGQWFTAMDSGHMHTFGFSEAVSLLIRCNSQKEIDDYTDKLSAVPDAEQCGWMKDKYGVSWQASPAIMDEMLFGDPDRMDRWMKLFLRMKRVDIQTLQETLKGE